LQTRTDLSFDWAAAIVRQEDLALLFGRVLRDPHGVRKRFSIIGVLVER
jgi:hypothetical protein